MYKYLYANKKIMRLFSGSATFSPRIGVEGQSFKLNLYALVSNQSNERTDQKFEYRGAN